MRRQRLILGAVAVLMVGTGLAFVALAHSLPQIFRAFGIPLVLLGAVFLFLWYAMKPRALKADAKEVRYVAGLDGRRMPRADLGFIFRGQLFQPTRLGGYWEKSYIFAASDGKVGMSLSAPWFSYDGITEFAQRLQVPIRGDFSVRVQGRVDPKAT